MPTPKPHDLEGRSILVAGAGGIGAELAARYAREGALVTLADLDLERSQRVVSEILDAGGRATAVRMDGADESSIASAVQHAHSTFGSLYGLHANFASFADGAQNAGVIDLPLPAYDETMQVNARGFFLCTRYALPKIIAGGGGCVLYTSSAGAYLSSMRVAYSMSKAAVNALMRHVATRFGRDRVRANCIAPGTIVHPRMEAGLPTTFRADSLKGIPLKERLGEPSDIAGISALLMSNDGAFITGQVISVDGGLTMRA